MWHSLQDIYLSVASLLHTLQIEALNFRCIFTSFSSSKICISLDWTSSKIVPTFSMLFKLILHQNWSIWGQYYRLNIKFYNIPISTQKTLEKKTSCHGYRYTASCHCYHYHYTLRKNGLLHRVSLQVFEKVFRTHSVGHLVIASILFNSNFIKHVRFCRIRFLQIFKSFSSNLL